MIMLLQQKQHLCLQIFEFIPAWKNIAKGQCLICTRVAGHVIIKTKGIMILIWMYKIPGNTKRISWDRPMEYLYFSIFFFFFSFGFPFKQAQNISYSVRLPWFLCQLPHFESGLNINTQFQLALDRIRLLWIQL